jgi:hypothetical protein
VAVPNLGITSFNKVRNKNKNKKKERKNSSPLYMSEKTKKLRVFEDCTCRAIGIGAAVGNQQKHFLRKQHH